MGDGGLRPTRKGLLLIASLHLPACREPPREPPDRLSRLAASAVRHAGDPDLQLRLGRGWLDLGRRGEAAAAYRESLRLLPSASRAAQLGKELWDGGEQVVALELWHAGLVSAPADPVLLRNAGFAYYQRGDYARAADNYRRAVDAAPDNRAARIDLGWALWKAGQIVAARACVQQVLDRAPDDASALALGRALDTAERSAP